MTWEGNPRSFVERSGYGLKGFAEIYENYRPHPPDLILDILTQMVEARKPRLVVDLGSGTGISTRLWADKAEKVLGIEPNPDIRRYAQMRTKLLLPRIENVNYQDGLSTQTGLSDNCADIVTCAQSLHWMEPEPTFVEVARVLRLGGVFAAYDYTWPPTMHWEVEAAYYTFMDKFHQFSEKRGFVRGIKMWPKSEHLKRMQASGVFRYVKEIAFHSIETGNAERLVGLVISRGPVFTLLEQGASEEEIGLSELRTIAERVLGNTPSPWYISHRMWLGIK